VPLDTDRILASVGKTKRAVVAHSATTFAGPGAEVAATIAEGLFGELLAPVQRVGARFSPIPSAQELEAATLPSAASILAAVRTALDGSHG
jgi:acetoin:2,6-dichlorophenolindophenol oxidoreductase subunit beta